MRNVLFSLFLSIVSMFAQAQEFETPDWHQTYTVKPCNGLVVKHYDRRIIVEHSGYYWERAAVYHVHGKPAIALVEVSNGTYVFPGTPTQYHRVNRTGTYNNGTWKWFSPTVDGDLSVHRKPTLEKIVQDYKISGCI